MTVLRPVVQTLMREMPDRGTKFSSRCSIGFQLVSDHATEAHPLPFQKPGQQISGCFGVATGLQDFVENIAILIDCARQPVRLSTAHDLHFVQMPNSARLGLPASQGAGIGCTELQALSTDRLV